KKPLTGEQVRWGAEHLNVDKSRLAALGFDGMMEPLKTSCTDHVGVHRARIHTWDGSQWNYTSDWYESNWKMLRPMMEAQAAKYVKEKGITPRDCSKES
ncbi:MAG: ABC transporter permease, partial [Planctomycetaceae bacterium]|nr:ABC transporter permease [Planctomycetaceae bacterium]